MHNGAQKRKRYSFDEVIGSGGMGVVQRAFDNYKGRYVAIKRLSIDEKANEEKNRKNRVLFEREYHTLAQLAHPAIIQVYDYGVDQGESFYTMELLEGESLRELAPLHWRRACKLLRDVVSSLSVIHSRRLLHRDITPNNIYCTADGRAKLIDFGAMTPMGVAEHLVGTAQFMPPETVQRQPLDGRTDLFSLGATLYYVLTARHAYPARDIKQLRDLWRTRPPAPSRLCPDIPEALDQLVLSLISLSPSSRPSTAAEVFERLTVIADLSTEEQLDVAHAYLNSPSLVGRDVALTSVRRRLIKASRRRGGVVLVEGDPGVGRSRFLDASVLEAKLLGFSAIRTEGKCAYTGPFAVAQQIARELLAIDSNIEQRLVKSGLSQLVRDAAGRIESAKQTHRDSVIEELSQLLVEISQNNALAIVVDDLDQVDEPSLALLASLSTPIGRERILIAASVESEAQQNSSSAVGLLSITAKRLRLEALSELECRVMLSSVFGEIPNLDVLNMLAYQSCSGKPRELMEIANALVEQRVVRYESGVWIISDDFETLERAMGRGIDIQNRLDGLSEYALELVSLVALDLDQLMDLDDYVELCTHADMTRIYTALNELIQKDLLQPIGAHYRFVHRTYQRQIVAALTEERRRALHQRLAERVAVKGVNPIYHAYHLLHAGKLSQTKKPMHRFQEFADEYPRADILRNPIVFETVEGIFQRAEQLGRAPIDYIAYRAGLIVIAYSRGLPEHVAYHARRATFELSLLSGLSDYKELDHLSNSERLQTALRRARQRCQKRSSSTDAIDPESAIRLLSKTVLYTAAAAFSMADSDLIDDIPSLLPFTPLSPLVGVVERLVGAIGKLVKGQEWEAWKEFEGLYNVLVALDSSVADNRTRLILLGLAGGHLCGLEAEYAYRYAPARIDQYALLQPSLSQGFRARYLFALGDTPAAEVAHRHYEVMSVQTGERQDFLVLELKALLKISILSDDLMGLKRTIKKLQAVVRTRPRWKHRLAVAKAHYLRCSGRTEPALALIEAAISATNQNHADWSLLAFSHVNLLSLVGNHRDATERGTEYLEQATEMRVPTANLELALASAHCESGDYAKAQHRFETALATFERRGIGGVYLGYCYEIGARIAMRRGDHRTFNRHANRCSELYRVDVNPVLTAKFDALIREAEDRKVVLAASLLRATNGRGADESNEVLAARIHEITDSVKNPEERFRAVFDLLLEQFEASGGLLYLNTSDGLRCATVSEGLGIPEKLDEEIKNYYDAEIESSDTFITATAFDGRNTGGRTPLMTTHGDRLVPFLLEYSSVQGVNTCGVVVLAVSPEKELPDRFETISTVARYLSEQQLVISSILV